MSVSSQLIFTASSQKNYNSFGEGDGDDAIMGIENPNNYRNNLRNVIKIPARSEIALVNAEFNRSISFQLDEDDLFYWYYGEQLNGTLPLSCDKVGSIPYPIKILTDGYSRDELQSLDSSALFRIVQKSINYGVSHPDWHNSAIVESDLTGQKIKIKMAFAGKDVRPFGIPKYAAGGVAPGSVLSWMGLDKQNDETYDSSLYWAATTALGGTAGDTLTRIAATSAFGPDWDSVSRVVCRSSPLSSFKGEWSGDFTLAPSGFGLCLTRPQTHDMWDNNFQDLLDYRGLNGVDDTWKFGDYEVKYWDADDGGTKKIHVYHVVRNDEGDPDDVGYQTFSETREIIYWANPNPGGRPTKQITEADMISAGKSYAFFHWTLEGNSISFKISDTADLSGLNNQLVFSSRIVDEDTGVPLDIKPIPTNQETEALYPIIDIPTQTESIKTLKWETSASTSDNRGDVITPGTISYNYPLDPEDRSNTEIFLGATYDETDQGDAFYDGGTSMWGAAYAGVGVTEPDEFFRVMDDGVLNLACRYYKINGLSAINAATFPMRWVGLDPFDEAPGLSNGIINVATDDGVEYGSPFNDNGAYYTLPEAPPNASLVLGMAYKNFIQGLDGISSKVNAVVDATARSSWSVEGTTALGEDPNPLLVEVPSLNHQSYNMCRQCPSKFIYVCPRHDNSGGQFGRLFYEPGEKTYISLNNPGELNITDLEIRFTDKNGITTSELIGSSAVTFHIRKERV